MELFDVVGRARGYMGYPMVCLQQPGQKLRHGNAKDPHRKGASTPLHTILNHSPVMREEMEVFLPCSHYGCYGRKMYSPSKVWQDNRNTGGK